MTSKTIASRYRNLADYIESQPARNFKQGRWFCGTAACIAGHCSIMLGWIPAKDNSDDHDDLIKKGTRVDYASNVASEYLGIDATAHLFNYGHTWNTKKGAVKELRKRANAIEVGCNPIDLDNLSSNLIHRPN